jgi:hypothetical protein
VVDDVEEFLGFHATDDVRATVRWLVDNGYVFARYDGGSSGLSAFGSSFVYIGDAEVAVTVDKSQWYLDISATPGAASLQFDLLVAAFRGLPYWELFPINRSRDRPARLPEQLPPGVVWRDTLPQVLAWLARTDAAEVAAAAKLAQNQRFAGTWPESQTARKLTSAWRAQGMPLP